MTDPAMMQQVLALRADNERGFTPAPADPLVLEQEMQLDVGGRYVPVIVYTPKEHGESPLPVFFSIHGGGFVMARAAMDGAYCRRIARDVGCVVVNIDYRLSPEVTYPAALDDCYGAIKWVHAHAERIGIDQQRMAVGGYSAGANLSTVLCMLAKEKGELSLCYQVLCYGPMDLTGGHEFDDVPTDQLDMFPPEIERLFNSAYIGAADPRDGKLSPLYAPSLAGLPPALLVAGERDGLVCQSRAYARRLRESGVTTELQLYPGVSHGFTHGSGPEAEAAWQLITHRLRQALSA